MALRIAVLIALVSALAGCNDLLEIREPADQIWLLDGSIGMDSQGISGDEDAGDE